MGAEDIRDEKVKVLRSMQTVRLEDMVLGQYRGRRVKGMSQPGYLEDPTVPPNRLGLDEEGMGPWVSSLMQPAVACKVSSHPCVPQMQVTALRAAWASPPSYINGARSSPNTPPSLPCSLTPTFAACAVFLNNARWDGVPFLLKAGKALEGRMAEIRVQFRHVPGSLYRDKLGFSAGMSSESATNELVSRGVGWWWW